MKKNIGTIVVTLGVLYGTAFALDGFLPDDDIYTKTQEEILNTDDITENPLRQGAGEFLDGAGGQGGVAGDFVRPLDTDASFDGSFESTLSIVRTAINYILGFLALVALIYLIINGLIMIFAKDDEAQKNAGNALKTAGLGIAGIALSWFVVSAIFWIVGLATG